MTKRAISLLLALVMLLSLCVTAHAADSEAGAMGEVNIYNGDYELSYLSMNGIVRTQKYTYYNYHSPTTGKTTEGPAYCVDPNTKGVPQSVDPGAYIQYALQSFASDPKAVGIVSNGYPHRGLAELGLENKYQAYYATKMALWCYILPNWSIKSLTVNPNLTGLELTRVQKILAAAKDIYSRGIWWNSIPRATLTATPDQKSAYAVTIDGKAYKQQIFTLSAGSWVCNYTVNVAFSNPSAVPEGTKIVDMSNRVTATATTEYTSASDTYEGQFKILYPADSVAGQSGTVQLTLSSSQYQYAVYYATCAETGKYGNLQNYMCDTDPTHPVAVSALSRYATGPDVEPPTTGLEILKVDEGTNKPLAGAVFEVTDPEGRTLGSYSTDSSGRVLLNLTLSGHYTITETTPPAHYLLSDTPTRHVTVTYGEVSTVTFANAPYGSLRVEKIDADSGGRLTGALVQVKHIESGAVYTAYTGTGGTAYFTGLVPGAYEVTELAAPSGYVLEEQVTTATVTTGETVTVTLKNSAKPGLTIVKYDSQTKTLLPGVTFAVYRDAALLGSYTTGELGEINLYDLQPGTYLVQEVSTTSGHVLDSTPQEIKLAAGDGVKTLTFFNTVKPGIHLVKVDSATMKPLPNAAYLISKGGGTFSKEYTTDQNGEIDLTGLEPGAYTVKEVKAPDGYLVDDSTRIVQLNAGENTQFVFTDTIKPSLAVVKYDPQSNQYLAGATFRIAAIADGSHHLDRVTDTQGRIDLTGMEPGVYSVQELAAPEGYIKNDTEYHVELFPGKTSELVVTNEAKPNLKIIKTDAITGEPVAGVTFTVRKADSATLSTVTTGADGTAALLKLDPGVYEIIEQSVPVGYLLDDTPQLITLVPGRIGIVQFQNYPRPALEILKTDTAAQPIPDAVFTVAKKDGTLIGDFSTGQDGKIHVYNLDAGYYIITEKSVPAPYILDTTPHEILMVEGKTTGVTLENKRLPDLTVSKVDSITGDPLQGAKFTVWYAVNGSLSGDLREIGSYATDENGLFTLNAVEPGWYRVTETEPPAGYALKDPSTLDVFMEADHDKAVTFENQPLNSLILKKVDAIDGHVLQGAKFRVRYFEGVTGTGGTTIGEYETSANGTIVITGLKAGTYIIEETRAPEGYIIDDAPKTVYMSGKEQAAVTVEFANQPDSGLTITKLDSVTKESLAGAVFEIRSSAGAVVGNSNGIYTTDESGTIHLPSLPTDTYTVKETKAPEGYVLDGTPQTVKLIHGETHSLTFYNAPKGALVITKLDSETKKPLAGATFQITTSSGAFVAAQGGAVSSNGLYTTDQSGQIILSALEPDTYVITETKAPSGYELDATPQTVAVNAHDTQTLYFYNTSTPEGGLRIVKLDEETRQPISGVTFAVTRMDGAQVGTYRTDSRGIISLPSLTPGWYTVTEKKAADGYELDAEPRNVEVKDGEIATVEVTNRQQSAIVIRKVDSQTGEGLYGATFVLYDSKDNPIGEYRSNQRGYVYIDGIADGRYKLREIDAPEGYLLDSDYKTVYVRYGGSSEIRWENTAVKGQIQIVKKSADYNSVNGLPAGTLLAGATFTVYNERTGNKVDTIVTGANGLAVSKQLPLGRYTVRETKAPAGYAASGADITAVLEYSSQIVRFEVLNTSVNTGVAITKTGPKEAVGGQPVRYVFSGIANTGNVTLESFYWRDTLPAAVRLFKVVTGTYNRTGSYKIVYKVNGVGDYRTLADNLSTAKNYELIASPAALGLAANERVTEIMFVFGQAPGGFAQVEAPMLYTTAAPGLAAGSSFVNNADVGGVYNGAWVQAVTRWVTTVYGKPITLPRTGY